MKKNSGVSITFFYCVLSFALYEKTMSYPNILRLPLRKLQNLSVKLYFCMYEAIFLYIKLFLFNV